MSKVQKALGKLRYKTQVAEAAVKAARKAQGAVRLNHMLNATVVEQNERMETLADNCRHYRQAKADLQDKVSELEDANGKLYSQLKTAQSHVFELEQDIINQRREYRDNLLNDRYEGNVKLRECQSYLRQSRISTIVVTLALVAVTAWPYVVKLLS